MPKVSKLKSPAGRKGLSMRAMQDDPDSSDRLDEMMKIDPDDQFKDATDPAVPALPPINVNDDAAAGSGENGNGGENGDSDKVVGGGLKQDPDTTTDDNSAKPPSGGLLNANPPASLANDFRGGQESWNAMLYQLLLYKAQRGDLNIPHNDTSYRLLYNWVQTQRKHYKLYQENKTSSTFLNADRIAVLDAIDFQWNVRGDTFWQKNFDSLVGYKNEHGDARVPRLYTKNPKLGEWVTDQRRQWKAKSEGKPNMMTDERKTKLDELGFVWKVRDRADWNDRYEQLLEFKKENGHCIVPQHYTRNRALGKWVAKQREQYRFYREGKHSFLTEERIDLLKSVGFVWQIKGRGANKKLAAGKSAAAGGASTLNMNIDDHKEKSLAKVEEEEKAKGLVMNNGEPMAVAEEITLPGLKAPPSIVATGLGGSMMGTGQKVEDSGGFGMSQQLDQDQKMLSLPPISQQQLLQANMAAIAAHASSNQNMVADLAAALRLGGANPGAVAVATLNGANPSAVAALRAAQLGNNDPSPRSFSSMI